MFLGRCNEREERRKRRREREREKRRECDAMPMFRLFLLLGTLCPESGGGSGGKEGGRARGACVGENGRLMLRCVASLSMSPAGGKWPILFLVLVRRRSGTHHGQQHACQGG